jgi:two-component system NtrC family sensor kinase
MLGENNPLHVAKRGQGWGTLPIHAAHSGLACSVLTRRENRSMKLARKLTFAILAVMVAVLSLNALERVVRDRRLVRDDIRRDHRSLGRALQVVVHESFREDGEQRALKLVEAANQRESAARISWRWLDRGTTPDPLSATQVTALSRGQDVEVVATRLGLPWLYTYAPVRLDDGRSGTIELAEPLAFEDEIVRAVVLRTVMSTLLIGVLAALVTNWLGVWMVGRPVAQLMEMARRVGAGDLSHPIALAQRDELGDLAAEMNAMCERLEREQRARQQALEQLRHAERINTVGRLAAGVAHELGTPLNVVGLEAKRIAVGRAVGEAAQEGAKVIATQAERMTLIISQLLDFARRRSPRMSAVELGEVASTTLSLVAALAARSGVTLCHEAAQKVHVNADAGQMQQVLTNLVVNALQASPPGAEVRVTTGHEPSDHQPTRAAFVRVVDAGSGIEPDALPRIFEPFFTTKDVGQGTGLGLAVAEGIVEEHGGRIEVTSAPGAGASFTVRLPALEVS